MNTDCNGLFNIRNLMSSLILMFVRICLCDAILYTWFEKKWKRLKKFWGWKICLVYAYFFKHLSLSMLVSFMLIKKEYILECLFKIENSETYSLIKKETLPNVFYYELYKVLIDIDICLENIGRAISYMFIYIMSYQISYFPIKNLSSYLYTLFCFSFQQKHFSLMWIIHILVCLLFSCTWRN